MRVKPDPADRPQHAFVAPVQNSGPPQAAAISPSTGRPHHITTDPGAPMPNPFRGSLPSKATPSRTEEWRSFLFLSIVMAPVIAGAVVVTYGFAVWIFQMLAGPPTS
jgi:nitrate reductase NapE